MKHKYRKMISGLALAVCFAFVLAPSGLRAAEVTLLQESFETDGAGTRYTVQNPSDDGESDYFARRELGSAGTAVDRGTMDGDFFWGAEDIDGDGEAVDDLLATQARINFSEFSIAGVGNLVIRASAAQGYDTVEWNNALYFEYSIDGGEWFSVGGFRGTFTNSPARYYEGDTQTYPDENNPRLSRAFKDFEWRVFGSGDTMRVRVFADLNGGNEEYDIDNIQVIGDDAVGALTFTTDKTDYVETDGTGTLTFTLDPAAPAGGLPVSFEFNAFAESEVSIATVNIPEGMTSFEADFDILADGRFDGNAEVFIRASAPGYSRDQVRITVENVDPEPSLVINEMYPNPRGDNAEDEFAGNANGDDTFVHTQEEYMEMVNTGSEPLDLSNWIIRDGTSPRHFFPAGTVLEPGGVIVVFGGGDPTGIFGGAIVQTATSGNLGMTDDGDTMSITVALEVAAQATYDPEVGVSGHTATRNPDITGDFVDITTVPAAGGAFFSPGTRVDGTPFQSYGNSITLALSTDTIAENAAADSVTANVTLASPAPSGGATVTLAVEGDNADEIAMASDTISIAEGETQGSASLSPVNDGILDGDRLVRLKATAPDMLLGRARLTVTETSTNVLDGVVVNEALPSILDLGLDVNGNGVFDELVDDQYIEIVNGSANAVDLSGFSLYAYNIENQTGRRLVHIFPNGSVFDPDGAIVIFGGGIEADLNERSESLFGGAIIQVANRGGNGVNLPDSLDGVIELVTPDGFVVDEVVYLEENANQIMAVTRSPDITGDFGFLHLEATGGLLDLSPGTDIEGNPFAGNGVSNDIGGAPVEGLEGWFESSWLGFYSPIGDSDWLFHGEHGFIYYFPDNTASNAFIYDDATSTWWWTTADSYPFIYMFDPPADNGGTDIAEEWVFYFLGTTAPRSFGVVTGPEAGGFLFFP